MPDFSTGSSKMQVYYLALRFYLIIKLRQHIYAEESTG